jgi:hypothetical protein
MAKQTGRTRLRKELVLDATKPHLWDFSDGLLYRLCKAYPHHRKSDRTTTLAKVHHIGRIYAAAIERGIKRKRGKHLLFDVVEPAIRRSDLDKWLKQARSVNPRSAVALDIAIEAHGRTTALFSKISDRDNRSLASKYLHFHVPKLFFIYDSRAAKAIQHVGARVVGRASKGTGNGDNAYRKFAEKCARLRAYCRRKFGVWLTPRQLDRLLLAIESRARR